MATHSQQAANQMFENLFDGQAVLIAAGVASVAMMFFARWQS
jgi:hypothetical protein